MSSNNISLNVTEKVCPICLEALSAKPTSVLAAHPSGCRHEFCNDCLEDFCFELLIASDYETPVVLKCPVCRTEYEILETVNEILKPVWNVDKYEGMHMIDMSLDE